MNRDTFGKQPANHPNSKNKVPLVTIQDATEESGDISAVAPDVTHFE